MPNWCENQLQVTGSKSDLLWFQASVKGKHAQYVLTEAEKEMVARFGEEKEEELYNFTFHSLVPVPEEVLQAGYNKTGYNWQNDNWGTKWDVTGALLDEADNQLLYQFDTAWAPPEPWVKCVSEQFPNLSFELAYFEPGMMFAGYVTYENGERVEEEHASESVPNIKHMMVEKLGYSEEEANEYWHDEEEEEEII